MNNVKDFAFSFVRDSINPRVKIYSANTTLAIRQLNFYSDMEWTTILAKYLLLVFEAMFNLNTVRG